MLPFALMAFVSSSSFILGLISAMIMGAAWLIDMGRGSYKEKIRTVNVKKRYVFT